MLIVPLQIFSPTLRPSDLNPSAFGPIPGVSQDTQPEATTPPREVTHAAPPHPHLQPSSPPNPKATPYTPPAAIAKHATPPP
jgi:hypothetical protein